MKIGFIGLGTMGASLASNLQKSGLHLIVHDVNEETAGQHLKAGASWADTPKQLALQSDVILTSLPGPPEIEEVYLKAGTGLIEGLKKDQVCCDLSTNSPSLIRHIHDEFGKKGVHVLDAPVSGGPKGAKSGKLAIWVGGDEKVFLKNRF